MTQSQKEIALVLFAKRPVPGKVKSRLAEAVGEEAACDFYQAMANDTWANLLSFGHPCILATDGDGTPWLPDAEMVVLQPDGSFGERIDAVLNEIVSNGYSTVIVLGADTPHLPEEVITMAVDALTKDEMDVVVSPSDDGGLALFGTVLPPPIDIAALPWETAKLDGAMRDMCKDIRFKRLMPGSYNIGTIEDIRRLLKGPDDFKSCCPTLVKVVRDFFGI